MAEVLTGAGLLGPGQRVWLRPRQLPAPLEVGVSEALSQLRTASGSLLAVHGVCVAATAVFQRPAVRAFQCAACERLCVLHSLARPPPCCGDGTAGGMVHEVEAARVMVPVRGLWMLGCWVPFLFAAQKLEGRPAGVRGGEPCRLASLPSVPARLPLHSLPSFCARARARAPPPPPPPPRPQAQTVFLCTDDPLPAAPAPQLGAALLAVHLADDLAGQARGLLCRHPLLGWRMRGARFVLLHRCLDD